jgi:outer membrane lipoprotein SlyB
MSGEYKNVVGYSPSDFFYVSALDSSQNINIDCANIDLGILNANTIGNITDENGNIIGNILGNIIGNVYGNVLGNVDGNVVLQVYKDICQNKGLVNSWTNHKVNHSGSTQALEDSQTHFNATMLNTINLVIGIGFLTWTLTNGWMYR